MARTRKKNICAHYCPFQRISARKIREIYAKTNAGTYLKDPRYSWLPIMVPALIIVAFIYMRAPTTEVLNPELTIPQLPAMKVHPTTLSPLVHSQGTARARDTLELTMASSGEVVEVAENFRSGSLVKAGDPLVTLDPEPFSLEISRHKHELALAKLNQEQAQADATVARRNSGEQRTALALRLPQVNKAVTQVNAAEAALRMARRRHEGATLNAPFGGWLTDVQVTQGQQVASGQIIGRLYNTAVMEVRLPVPDERLRLLLTPQERRNGALNIPVTLSGNFAGWEHFWKGHITRREGGLSRNQMSWLIAEINNDTALVPLEPGVYVEAAIQGRQQRNVYSVPRDALLKNDYVWKVDAENRLIKQKVSWVHRDDSRAYINQGLESGDIVLAQGHESLLEGTKVEPSLKVSFSQAEADRESSGTAP